jgi:hypothetical protein
LRYSIMSRRASRLLPVLPARRHAPGPSAD